MADISISELIIYPLKSAAGIKLETASIDTFGLKNDRRWMLVDKQGMMVTQRKHAKMCLLKPRLIDNQLYLQATGFNELCVPAADEHHRQSATVWDDQCLANDCGDMAAEWLSDFLGVHCRLVYFPEHENRQVDLNYAQAGDRTAFSDGFPILLTTQSSLDDLNQRMAEPIGMERFRPNLVVTGAEAYAEDQWKQLQVGEINLRVVKPCSRCVIPNIDPLTAETHNEPALTLARYRKRGNKIFFGQNLIHDQQGTISTGMPVKIIE